MDNGGHLRLVEHDEGRLEVVDDDGDWLVRIESLADDDATPASVVGAVLLGGLAEQVPGLLTALADAKTMRVAFSPAVTAGLRNGTLVKTFSKGRALPVARVAATGQFAGQAREVVGDGVKAGLKAGPTLAAAVAIAAAVAQQQWLEQTLAGIAETAAAIEERLRDDDWGLLEHAERLAADCWAAAATGRIPDQLRAELAAVRPQVGTILRSRSRFTRRLIDRLEDAYAEKDRKGQEEPWTAAVVDALGGALDELLVHLASLHTMGRVDAATAALMALDGDGAEAVGLVERSVADARDDYNLLYRYFRPLARFTPAPGRLGSLVDRVPVAAIADLSPAANARRVHQQAKQLFGYLDERVGARMPELGDTSEVVVRLEPVA